MHAGGGGGVVPNKPADASQLYRPQVSFAPRRTALRRHGMVRALRGGLHGNARRTTRGIHAVTDGGPLVGSAWSCTLYHRSRVRLFSAHISKSRPEASWQGAAVAMLWFQGEII